MATATAPASAGLLRAAVPNPNSIRSAHPHLHSLPSSSPSFPSSTSFRPIIKHLACTDRSIRITCSVGYREPYTPPAGAYPRPSEIQWKKELCNSVQLIGVVASPVQINQLNSGKVVASSRLAVWKSATDTTWINVTFWDDLAHTAFQHLEKGQRVYVSGRLVSDTVESDGGKQQTFYKVVVQQLNFIEKSFPSPVDLYDSDSGSTASGRIINNSSGNNKASVEQLWQAFFANPTDWWDNRKMKKNPKGPDFKHKDTGEALWVDGRYNPPWVNSQLEILDARMGSFNLNQQDNSRPFDFLDGSGYPPPF